MLGCMSSVAFVVEARMSDASVFGPLVVLALVAFCFLLSAWENKL